MGKREANKLQTRRALLDAARSLAAERGTFPGVEDVATLAGVSRATFFNYFASKDDLVTALFAERMERLAVRVDDQLALDISTGERIGALFAAFVRARGSQSGFYFSLVAEADRFSHDADAVAERHRIFDAQLRRIIDAGLERGDVRDDITPQLLAELIRATYMATVTGNRGDNGQDLVGRFDEAARFVASAISR